MKKLKILTLVGTRPEIIKLSRVIAELKKFTNHILVHTGQNFDYELNEIFFEQLEISKPDHFLNAAGVTAAETIANVIVGLDRILATEKPDAFLLLGDTNSTLGVISAKKHKIPIFHMEAGNRCFDQRVPEENNRKIVDHLSDINLPYTEHARRYLISEGLKPEQIIKIGSPMREVLEYHREKINCSDILNRLKLSKRNFFLVSAHREENVDSEQNLINFIRTLNMIAETWKEPIIVSTHPRTRQRLELPFVANIKINPLIHFLKPLGFYDYVHLEQNSRCVISDSGTITEEASILNFPAVTIRQSHERPEGMDIGVLIMSGLNPERVIQSIEIVTSQHESKNYQHKIAEDYQQHCVSRNVLRIIISYIDYVNRVVWQKT
jgi:UDP-N-acetylglucosamine 2-epimerase (non-hydrolysing)